MVDSIPLLCKLSHFRVSAKDGTGISDLFSGVTARLDLENKSCPRSSLQFGRDDINTSKPLRNERDGKNTQLYLTEGVEGQE